MLKTFIFVPFLALGLVAIAPQSSLAADRRANMRLGRSRTLGSEYIGPEFDPGAQVYRLKFIRDGRVIFVDVDGRTGNILRQSR